jgi:Do/DeqQ family serine protease
MSVRRFVFVTLLLVCGFMAGMVLTGRMPSASLSDATAPPAPPEPSAPAPASPVPAPAAALPDFTRVAGATVPAVTNISSLQVVRRQNSPFANDPFFQYFFGDGDDLFGSRRGVESSLGSGVIVSADGYVLTNNHVVVGEGGRINLRNMPEITIALADKRELKAQIVGVDPPTDLALLKVDARNLPTIPWGDSSKLRVAEWVLAIGTPFQLDQTVTLGIVSAVGRRVGISDYEDFIQTDAAINPGNSGGALINARGELVGINTAIYSQSGGYQGIGFAVPSNLARRVMNDLIQYGEVRRGDIGYLELSPVTTRLAEQLGAPGPRGALVTAMSRDAAAYRAGLQPGDIVLAVNGQTVETPAQFTRMIQDARIGSTATLRVVRDGRDREITVPIQASSSRRRIRG